MAGGVGRSERRSRAMLAVSALFLLFTALAGYLNSTVVNGDHFADLINQVRQDENVKNEVGQALAAAAIDANPDMIAIEPAIAAVAGTVIGSPYLDRVFTPTIRSFHQALTVSGSDSVALTIADVGATVATALKQFVPQAAVVIPPDFSVTLAEVGGQSGIAAQIIPLVRAISTLAWLMPFLALISVGLALLWAPKRRVAMVRLGWVLMAVGGFLGLIVLGMNLAAALLDSSTLSGAVASAALTEFSQPLAVRFIATVVLGGLIVAAAGALLPQVDLAGHLQTVRSIATRRPQNSALAILRSLGLISIGLLIVLFPGVGAQAVIVLVGLGVVMVGVTELDLLAELSRDSDEQLESDQPGNGPGLKKWLIPVAASAAGLIVLGALVLPQHLPQAGDQLTPVASAEGCNGSVDLCDVPFDKVVIPATHNSMSIADGTWFLAEQPKDMVDSLDDGVRGLLVDTWYARPTENGGAITGDRSLAGAEEALVNTYGSEVAKSVRRTIDRVRRSAPSGPEVPYFCHTVCEIGSEPMLPVMQRLHTWLQQHPREVVVLFIQDTVTPTDTAEVLRTAGLADLSYAHAQGAPWPTLQQMIDIDKRLVVLMENNGGGTDYPFLHQGFDLVQDTEYTFGKASDFTCSLKRGTADSPLFSVNHWLASFATLVSSAEEVNSYDVLKARIDDCEQVRGRIPSMIAVNWYDRGALFRVVEELNRKVVAEHAAEGSGSPRPSAPSNP